MEEYLQTANGQLGNRRVRCCLMSDTIEEEREEETDTFTQNDPFTELILAALLHSPDLVCVLLSTSNALTTNACMNKIVNYNFFKWTTGKSKQGKQKRK